MDYAKLRTMPLDELQAAIYQGAPGSDWWEACLTEINIRNANRMATSLIDMSRVMDQVKNYTSALDTSARQMVGATTETVAVSKSIEKSSKKIEYATYALLLATVIMFLEPFFSTGLVFTRHRSASPGWG